MDQKKKTDADILTIPDDVWFFTFRYLTPLDFTFICLTCSHFNNFMHSNNYWKYGCEQLWSKANCKEPDFPSTLTRDLFGLFESIVDFILALLTSKHWQRYLQDTTRFTSVETLRRKIYLGEITAEKLVCRSSRHILELIIEHDRIEMFKIYLYYYTKKVYGSNIGNYSTSNYNQMACDTIETLSFKYQAISKPIVNFPYEGRNQFVIHRVFANDAMKIATYLLSKDVDSTKNDTYNNNNINDRKNNTMASICTNEDDHDIPLSLINSMVRSDTDTIVEESLLSTAVGLERIEFIQLLLKHPSMTKDEINKPRTGRRDRLGGTLLHQAVNKSIEIVRMLINDDRVDINAVDKRGKTAIMVAIDLQPKTALMLIENDKIDVNIQNNRGDTLLHMIVKMGLRHYFCPGVKDKNEQDEIAVQLAQKLLQRKDLDCNIKNSNGQLAVNFAKSINFVRMIQLLEKYGENCKQVVSRLC